MRMHAVPFFQYLYKTRRALPSSYCRATDARLPLRSADFIFAWIPSRHAGGVFDLQVGKGIATRELIPGNGPGIYHTLPGDRGKHVVWCMVYIINTKRC